MPTNPKYSSNSIIPVQESLPLYRDHSQEFPTDLRRQHQRQGENADCRRHAAPPRELLTYVRTYARTYNTTLFGTYEVALLIGRHWLNYSINITGNHIKYQVPGRAYGTHKTSGEPHPAAPSSCDPPALNLNIYLFLLTIFGPVYYSPP